MPAPEASEPDEEKTIEEEPETEVKEEQTQQLEQTAIENVTTTAEKEDKDLVGKAFETIKGNKANAYFLALIAFIVISLIIFNVIHEKRKE